MSFRTPEQIVAFIKEHQYRMDVPQQWYGDEPNSYRKPWDEAEVRTCLFACWAYGKPGPYLCDRSCSDR